MRLKFRFGQATDDNITWRMRITCYIRKTTDTHSESVILTAFLLQQRLQERASMLRYAFIACLVQTYIFLQCANHH